ncbi:hypothetical protein [Aporhodopirellula aestuarii]|uniref:Secreted protein n=1 Tax=Aporhodopirellula aestuarii TaxID=2950107 RepID=A0ABT0TZ77_9BACT|nr:hypothetical protein [Aporhodopirellula aestuarii]MCM2369548.1 hypothetical protein [Aporhodopirellula aestuarii]
MTRILFSLAALCLFTASTVTADDSSDSSKGLCAGDNISMFLVTKVAGAEDDGVEAGATTCYRCKYGQRPMVMVFTRSTDGAVAKFVKELDSTVAKHADDQLKGLVTLIGGESEDLTSQAKAIADKTDAKHVPIVVAKDTDNGPASYKLDDQTAVTVVLVNHSQVVARHDFAADKIDSAAVMTQVNEMLN